MRLVWQKTKTTTITERTELIDTNNIEDGPYIEERTNRRKVISLQSNIPWTREW